jgi:hypothetical protein
MAKGNNLILQGLSGKIAGVVVSKSADGQVILRSKPSTVRQPNTDAQISQKTKFSKIVQIARLNKNVIRAYTKPKNSVTSSYSTFIGTNVKGATAGTGALASVDYEKLRTVTGGGADVYSLDVAVLAHPTIANTDNVNLAWNYDANNPTHNAADQIGLVTIDKTLQVISVSLLTADITTGTHTAQVPQSVQGERIIIPFVYFNSSKRGAEIGKYVLQTAGSPSSTNNR